MQGATKQKSINSSIECHKRKQTRKLRNFGSTSPKMSTNRNSLLNSNFQYHQKVNYLEIPSLPTPTDLEYKSLIRKSYFKQYTKESISPIKGSRRLPTLSENDFKEISQLIKIINLSK